MNHKLFTSCAAIIMAIVLLSCGGSKLVGGTKNSLPGSWQVQPIAVDGDSKDWPSPYPNYDNKAMVAYATSNDANNLYITMQTGDERTLLKILKKGLTISIDTNGKKDGQFHISYPLPNDNDNTDVVKDFALGNDRSRLSGKQAELKINRLMQEANQISLEGFADCNGGYMSSQTLPCGIKVKARMDEYKEMVWEAAIPFKAIYGRDSISAADAGKPISVCYAIKSFKTVTVKNGGGDNSSMTNEQGMAGNNSRMRSGGGHTTSRNTTQDPNQHFYDNTKTWKQFGIAYQR